MSEITNFTTFPLYHQIGPYWQPMSSFAVPRKLDIRLQVVVKATFTFSDEVRPRLHVCAEQRPILTEDVDSAEGYWENDLGLTKTGVDLVVLGDAVAPGGVPVPSMDVNFHIGAWQRTLRVHGDRHWERSPQGVLCASPPVPFAKLSLAFTHAFGGAYRYVDGTELPYAANPIGRGYCPPGGDIDCVGQPLPNIEAPAALLLAPGDQPEPAGCAVYRMGWSLRVQRGVQFTAEDAPQPLPGLWNFAHPDFILPSYPAGEVLEIQGMSASGSLFVPLPKEPLQLTHSGAAPVQAWPDTLLVEPQRRRLTTVTRWLVPAGDSVDPSTTLGELSWPAS